MSSKELLPRIGLLTFLLLFCGCFAKAQIPAGTVLPVMVRSTLDARRLKPGQTITGRVMQDVPLPDGQAIPRGTNVLGHIISVQAPSASAPSRLTLEFDQLEWKGSRVPVRSQLRALASMNEVYEAKLPTNAIDDYGTSPSDWNTVQIGGAGVFRGSGEVVEYGQIVGRATDYGAVTAKLVAAPKRGCSDGSESEQALWKFSPSACGTYGLSDVAIVHSEQGSDAGEIILQSSSSNVFIRGGSGWLLQVDSSSSTRSKAGQTAQQM